MISATGADLLYQTLKKSPKLQDELLRLGGGESLSEFLQKANDAFVQAKNQAKVWSGYDCSEIAEDIFEAVGEGKIIRIEGKNGNWLKVKQDDIIDEFQYHEVYVYENKVYDVRYDESPIGLDIFMSHIYEVNSAEIITTIIRQ